MSNNKISNREPVWSRGVLRNRRRIFLLAFSFFGVCQISRAQAISDVYAAGERALREGDLHSAELAFRKVLTTDDHSVGAHANLGVILMRRKHWDSALQQLKIAAALAPQVAGIRLNIGLVEYRSGGYPAAIPMFLSVLRDQPASEQARYWLGLSCFLVERYKDAQTYLQPLVEQQANNLQFLYVLGIAAGKNGDGETEKRALTRLMQVGNDSPEVHLLFGKADLAREQPEEALTEFKKAANANPKLPFVHYYLGEIARKSQDLEKARAEFLADAAIEPDVAFDQEELGNIAVALGHTKEAEDYYRRALALEPRLGTSHYALAKVYRNEGRLREALAEANLAGAQDANSASLHYLRAQILQKLKGPDAARTEFAAAAALRQKVQDEYARKISGASIRDPQVAGGSAEAPR